MESAFTILVTVAVTAQAVSPPNIIHLLMDDWGYGDVQIYGHSISPSKVETPQLDRFTASGITLCRVFAALVEQAGSHRAIQRNLVSILLFGQRQSVTLPLDKPTSSTSPFQPSCSWLNLTATPQLILANFTLAVRRNPKHPVSTSTTLTRVPRLTPRQTGVTPCHRHSTPTAPTQPAATATPPFGLASHRR
eukprot:m.8887 g.8887  ORF g.8887 m.8887 type:complete len:192 (+) comp9309_c0_seq6:61-636(+)